MSEPARRDSPEPARRLQLVVLAVIAVVLAALAAILVFNPAVFDISEEREKDKVKFRPD